jgi:hypothetical protein
MTSSRLRPSLIFAFAAAAVAAVPAAVTVMQAQVMVCYVEMCVPKGEGESCVIKEVPCIKPT